MSALYTHHQYIAGFFLLGAFAHGAIYLIRDANLTPGPWFTEPFLQVASGRLHWFTDSGACYGYANPDDG